MLNRTSSRVAFLLVIIFFLLATFYRSNGNLDPRNNGFDFGLGYPPETERPGKKAPDNGNEDENSVPTNRYGVTTSIAPPPRSRLTELSHSRPNASNINVAKLASTAELYQPDTDYYRILRSRTTQSGKYFVVDFAGDDAYNVNIIPHDKDPDKWYVIAQHIEYRDDIGSSEQLVCTAHFVDDVLHCPEWPTPLPLSPSIIGRCDERWAYTNMRRGPRDARVFYGPDAPYIMYGSQSSWGCLGIWLQDMRLLLDDVKHPPPESYFRGATEIRRPHPAQMEKNYFLFWDTKGEVFGHYDVWPKRSFSRVKQDGSPASGWFGSEGLDLSEFSEDLDSVCIGKLMPKLTPGSGEAESIHQATNSLSVTMCNRSDPSCTVNDDNTFIMHIFQYKTYYQGHGRYEPFVMLIRRREPYEIYAISQKPFWYHGRDILKENTNARLFWETTIPRPLNHTEMIYTTSITWKNHNQTYHGFLDDEIFLGFGGEDTWSGAMDVLAKDMMQDLELCEGLQQHYPN